MHAATPLLDDAVVESDDVTVRRGTLIELLADRERRLALERLAARDRAVPLAELSRQVAAATDATAADTRVRLHHHHLPKLDDAGLIEYTSERNVAAPTNAARTAVSHFDR